MKTLFSLLLLFLCLKLSAQESVIPAEIPEHTNDEVLKILLKDFYQSARFYRIAHISEVQNVDSVLFIKADLNMLGRISQDGKTIYLNEELKLYPAMLRILLFRQIGKLYEVPEAKKGHDIMGTHWELNLQHELYARHLATREWHDRHFFESLAEKAPIKKQL